MLLAWLGRARAVLLALAMYWQWCEQQRLCSAAPRDLEDIAAACSRAPYSKTLKTRFHALCRAVVTCRSCARCAGAFGARPRNVVTCVRSHSVALRAWPATMRLRSGLAALVLLLCPVVLASHAGRQLLGQDPHSFSDGQEVDLLVNKVGPFKNPRYVSFAARAR